MKLHLPTTLRAALIAALTAVGFTLSHAQAGDYANLALFDLKSGVYTPGETSMSLTQGSVTLTITTSWSNGLGSGTTSYTSFDAAAGVSTELLNSNAGLDSTNSIASTYGTFVSAGAKSADADLTITLSNLSAGETYNVSLVSGLDFEGQGSWSDIITSNSYTSSTDALGEQQLKVRSLSGFAVVDVVADNDGCITFTINSRGGHSAVINGIAIAGPAFVPVSSYTWAGTETDHSLTSSVWDDGSGAKVAYSDTKPLVFGTNGHRTVTIGSPTTAASMEVQAAGYVFENSGSLTAQKLTVADGASLQLKGTGDYIFNKATVIGSGALSIAEGAAMVLNGTNAQGVMGARVTGAGILKLTESASLANGFSSAATAGLSIEEGVILNQGNGDKGKVDLSSLSKVVLNGGGIVFTSQASTTNNLTVEEGKTGYFLSGDMDTNTHQFAGATRADGELTLANHWNSQMNVDALVGAGTFKVSGNNGATAFNPQSGSAEALKFSIQALSATDAAFTGDLIIDHTHTGDTFSVGTGTTAVNFNSLRLNIATAVDFNLGADTEIGNVTIDSGALNLAGTGGLTLGGLDGAGSFSNAAVITFNVDETTSAAYSGTLAINGVVKEGKGSQTLGSFNPTETIVVKDGTLVLTGTYAIDDLTSGMDIKYSGAEHAANGFKTTSGTAIVYTVADGAKLNRDGAQFTFSGEVVEVIDGKFQAEKKTDNTTFYVNVEEEASSKALASSELQHIILANGTTLNVDQDVAGGVVSVASGSATVNIQKDKAVNGTMQGATLTGEGTYALNTGTAALGTGVTLGEGWTGIVRIGGFASGNDTHLNDLVNGDKSILEINGITGGHLPEWIDGTVTANIRLADNGDTAAWTWTNGTTGTTPVNLTFSGKWSGDGTFVKTGGYNQSFTFTGDIKDWTGSFVYASGNYTTNLTLKDNVGEVNALIEKAGNGTLNILVETDVTFNAAIDASKLDVSAGKTATLHTDEDYTISGGLSGTGSLVKTGTGAVTIASPTGTSAAMLDITVSEGTLKATAANVLGTGDITVAENATLELTNGGALGGTQVVTSTGNVLIHETLTSGQINGGVLTLSDDFDVDGGEIKDVDDQITGNGFVQSGTIHVYDPSTTAALASITKIKHLSKEYELAQVVNGDITLDGADWNTYQINQVNASQPIVGSIMAYASKNGGTLEHIIVNVANPEWEPELTVNLTNDSDKLKASMLGGEHLYNLHLNMADGSALEIDADCAAYIYTQGEGSSSTVKLTTNATTGGMMAGDAGEAAAGTLTITGEGNTVQVDGVAVAFGSTLVIDKNVTVELLPMSYLSTMGNANVEMKSGASLALGETTFATVDGGESASIVVTSDEYLWMYDPAFTEYSIKGARITYNVTEGFDLGNIIDATSQVVNAGTGPMRDISSNAGYDELNALGGDIYISAPEGTDARTLTVGNLTLAADRTVAEDTGKTVSIKVTDTAKFGSGATVGAALTMAGGSTLDGSASLANHDLVLGAAAGDKLNIGDTLWGVLSGLKPEGTASLFTNVNALTLAGQGYAGPVDLTTIFSREGLNANKYSLSYDNDTVIVTRNKDNDRYWKGGSDTWNTTDNYWFDQETGGTAVNFVNGYNAHFTSAGGVITLGEDNIVADSVYVAGTDGANYVFMDGGHTLTVTNLFEVDGNHMVTMAFGLTGENLKLSTKNGGKLVLNDNSSVKTVQIGEGAVDVAASKTLTAGGVVLTGNGTVSGALSTASLTGTGTLTMDNGSLTFTADNLGNGVHLASKGNSAITAQGATLTFNESVANDSAGSVTFTGTFDVSNLSTTDGAAVYVDGEDSANGFKKAQKIVSVITAGTAKNGASVTFTYNGQSRDSVSEQGKITFDGATEYDKFYVNKSGSTEKVSTATGKFSPAPGTFVLADNTTLKVDENIAMSMVAVSGTAAKMVIDSGKTVTTDGTAKNLTLSGAGTLAVDTGKTATGVELDATNWTGTVSFTEAELATLSGAFTANSTVSLKGVTGSLGSDTVTGKLILNKGTGDWGFGQTVNGTITLNGAITGEGNLGVKGDTVNSTIILGGDINGWNGNFVANNANATLKLTGDDKTVNGTVTGTNLEVNVNADTTFSGALNVEKLTVGSSKAATLKANSTVNEVNALSGSTLKVDDGTELTVTANARPEGLKLGVGSTINLVDDAYMGGEDYAYYGGTVANGTDLEQAMTINNAGIIVTGTTLGTTGNTAFSVHNNLVNASFFALNELQQAVVLANVKDSLEIIDDLAIGATGSLKVADGDAKQDVNISSPSTLITAAGAQMDANLIINNGVTANMGGALDMNGGALTLIQSATLTGNLYDQIAALEGSGDSGKTVDLFTEVSALTLNTTPYSGSTQAQLYFSNLGDLSDKGDYLLEYNDVTGSVFIRFEATTAHTLTWNGTATEHRWVQDIDTVTDWLEGNPAASAYFQAGDNARFTADAAVKTVTIAQDITARNITIDSPELYTFENSDDYSITAQKFEMTGHDGLAKTGKGKLTLDIIGDVSLTESALMVQEGSLEIGTAAKSGKLDLQASALVIAKDAELSVATIEGDGTSSIELAGTMTVSEGTVSNLTATEGSLLKIADLGQTTAGTLSVDTDTTLYGLENGGTLDLGNKTLTLMEKTEQGGNVTAGKLNLAENGNEFNELGTNRVNYAYGSNGSGQLDAEAPNLVVDSIAPSMVIPSIALDVTETMGDGGSLAAINRLGDEVTYTLIHANDQTLVAGGFTLVGEALLIQNGLLHAESGLWSDGNNLNLTVGGLDLTWYTDKDVTEWGYQVVSGDALTAGGDTLNGVEHVVVDASRKIDVTGAGSEPGLRVRNITGLDGRTITFSGTEDDIVNLITNEETASNVNVAAENIRVNVGLHELDEMDPSDYESLHLGGMSLTGSYLDVAPEADLTVGALNGDSGSLLNGELTVDNAGGSYRGSYDNAHVILESTANQALAAKRGLTVSGTGVATLTYSGKDAVMEAIHGHDGVIVVLNDPDTDNSGNTLTLNEASEITDGFAIIGMSAVASARTLDTEAAPVLLAAPSLDMSGSTLIINQTDESSTIAMAVNDGGYKSNLYLAGFGAEDTNADDVQLIGYLYNKYYTNARMQSGRVLVDRNRSFYTDITAPTTENGRAGAGMLDDALLYTNPQVTNPDGDLATVMTALETGGYTHDRADKVMAAMSGASQAAMGAAWNRDVDRQLRAIRNRTTQMGLAECTHHEGLPYFNAWINAEGDYTKLSGDGTLAGYKLSSWGGTVGVDVDCTARFTVGAAVTAMSGNFTAESMDQAEGDLNRLYVSVFGRYARRAWTHTLVATFGMADTKLKRTVNYDYGSYNTESSSDGTAFGVMYEVGYVTALNEDASTCLQPVLNLSYRHSSLGGATEQSASDAALRLGDVDANVFTAAIGARLQSAVGTSVYNRSSIFEGRVMLKFDAGDRDTTAGNGFIGMPGSRSTKSTEAGMFGVEVGAGLTIPLSENAGALFFDVTGDFRAKDTEINGTVGYRYNF